MAHSITQFKDKYKGERCFIIGNGPSLARTPLSLIKGEYSIGINRIGMRYDKTDWRPSHFLCVTQWVKKDDYRADVLKSIDLGIPCFIGERIRHFINREDENITWVDCTFPHADESYDINKTSLKWWLRDISDGILNYYSNATFAATKLAVYMGFNPLIFVGCDLGWKGLNYLEYGLDHDHFDNRYEDATFEKPADHWDKFNPDAIRAHEIIRVCTKSIGVDVYNATLGGELEVYPRVNFLKTAMKISEPQPKGLDVKELLGQYKGERIFIVGCSKSLTVEQLDLIKGEYSFGLNRIAMLYDETEWRPTFYKAAPPEYLSYKPFRDDVIRSIELGIPSFLCVRLRSHVENGIEYGIGDAYDNVHYISCTARTHGEDLEWWATNYKEGGNVGRYSSSTFRSAMIAIKMGFEEIVFIGVDMDYQIHEEDGPDPNHFAPDYVPRLGRSDVHLEAINKSFLEQYERLEEQAKFLGIKVINATEGGLLEVFPRANLKELIKRE